MTDNFFYNVNNLFYDENLKKNYCFLQYMVQPIPLPI